MTAPLAHEPAAVQVADRTVAGTTAAAQWIQIQAAAPQIAVTMQRYLQRLAAFQAASSVDVAENSLRQLARWMITDAGLDSVASVRRDDVEDFKVWLAHKPHPRGGTISPETHRQRLRMVRSFFERIIEWDWSDAPVRNPVINGDIPKKPEPLPRFLDDHDAAKFMTAARASSDPRDRLVVELLARTGMRAGELAGLEADAVVQIGGNHWLRIPLGKLRNDRYVPLHPQLVTLLADWTAANLEHIRDHHRLVADHRGPLNRHTISRIIHRVGRAAGVDGVHPHWRRRRAHRPAPRSAGIGVRPGTRIWASPS
jgi:site-specific recombinase XerD